MRNSVEEPSRLGQYLTTTVAGEAVKAFIPSPLPPAGLQLNSLHQDLDRANQALGRLDGHMLHDIGLSPADVEQEVSKPFWQS